MVLYESIPQIDPEYSAIIHKSPWLHFCFIVIIDACTHQVSVAQWIARRTSNPKVVGSNPTRDENHFMDLHIN